MKSIFTALANGALLAIVTACGHIPPPSPSPAHLRATPPAVLPSTDSPAPASAPPTTPLPNTTPPAAKPIAETTYSVSVRHIPVTHLLHAIARDAQLNLDLAPGVEAVVSLDAYDQPLGQILRRIARQADLRIDLRNDVLVVMPDTPYLRSYQIDYVNLDRGMTSSVATSTQIATSSSGVDTQRNATGNTSLTRIETQSANHFWDSLERNIRAILKEHSRFVQQRKCEALARAARLGDGQGTDDAPTSASCQAQDGAEFIIANRETGVLMIRANSAQHEQVSAFIGQVQAAARRQVIIEATIVEVALSDGYKQGIEWTRLSDPAANVRTRNTNTDTAVLAPTLAYLSGTLDIKLELLESFGKVKVLSSPRLAVLNNQTAMLKVVEEVVYFLVDASTTAYGDSDREKITATTTPQSVSVGMVMALTPQISAHGDITLNVRPTISSISGFRDDPNPSLGAIPNRVPQIRTREIESILRLSSGDIGVLGGLIEDKIDTSTDSIPLLGAIPVLGELFTRRENTVQRTELVIFLRPLLVDRPAIDVDLSSYRAHLPEPGFFESEPGKRPALAGTASSRHAQ